MGFEKHLKKTNEHFWLTKQKKFIRPRDMGNNHLLNTIKLLHRWAKNELLQRELYCLAALSSDMGDGAYDAVSGEASALSHMTPHQFCFSELPIYQTLWKEWQLRRMG